jgi:hypothetical protein
MPHFTARLFGVEGFLLLFPFGFNLKLCKVELIESVEAMFRRNVLLMG